MVKVRCQVLQVVLIVSCLDGLVITVDLDGMVKKIQETSAFRLQEMLEWCLGVSGPCIVHLSCVTPSKIV